MFNLHAKGHSTLQFLTAEQAANAAIARFPVVDSIDRVKALMTLELEAVGCFRFIDRFSRGVTVYDSHRFSSAYEAARSLH